MLQGFGEANVFGKCKVVCDCGKVIAFFFAFAEKTKLVGGLLRPSQVDVCLRSRLRSEKLIF